MLRKGSELWVFTGADNVYKPDICRFYSSIRHTDPTAKYDGLPRRFLIESSSNEHFFTTDVSIPWEEWIENGVYGANGFNLSACSVLMTHACVQKRRENNILKPTI